MATTTTGRGAIPPRQYDAYFEPGHVRERYDDPDRPITRRLARNAVLTGQEEDNPVDRETDAWRFRQECDGMEVVVGVAEGRDPATDHLILTAYVDVVDAQTAWGSDEWSPKDVNVAALLQNLGGDKTLRGTGIQPQYVDVNHPIDYQGHRIINRSGYNLAVCIDCGVESDRKEDFQIKTCINEY